jgi:hypothetical protein
MARDSIGNGLVRHRHNGIDHVPGGVQAAIQPVMVLCTRRNATSASGNQQHRKKLLHFQSP